MKIDIEKYPILVRVQNLTAEKQPVELFNTTTLYKEQNLTGTKYVFDLSSDYAAALTFGYTTVAAIVKVGGTYSLYTVNNVANLPFANFTEVLNALNNLGFSVFTLVTGNTVETTTEDYVYSSITLTTLKPASYFFAGFNEPDFTVGGSLIFNQGFGQALTGSFTRISMANTYWRKTAGNFDGPFARSNATCSASGETVSIFTSINMASSKQVYIGFSTAWLNNALTTFGSQYFSLFVNNQKVVDITNNSTLTAFKNSINAALSTAFTDDNITYTVFNIIPVNLQAGANTIQLISVDSGDSPIVVLMVYDNTAQELAAATSDGDLNILFNSLVYSQEPRDFF